MPKSLTRLGRAELLPRYVHLRSLIEGRAVLEIGAIAATGGLSAHFLANRARSVVALDADAEAVTRASKTLGSATLQFSSVAVTEFPAGSFDTILVADFAQFPADPDALEKLLALLSASGYLVGGLASQRGRPILPGRGPEGPTMESIAGRLYGRLSSVEVLRQCPVRGYELGLDGAVQTSVDSSLAGEAVESHLVIVAGPKPLEGAPRLLVALSEDVAEAPEPENLPAGDAAEIRQLKAELYEARVDLVNRQAEVHELTLQLERTQEQARRWAEEQAGGTGDPLAELLESAHAQLKRAVDELRSSMGESARLREELKRYRRQANEEKASLEAELGAIRERAAVHVQEVDDLSTQLQQTARLLVEERGRLAALEKEQRRLVEEQQAWQQAASQDLSARVMELEQQLVSARATAEEGKSRLRRLEEEIELAKVREASDADILTVEQARGTELSATLAEVTAMLDAERARLKNVETTLTQTLERGDQVEKQFQALMREMTSLQTEKAEVEKQLAYERLERKRLEQSLAANAPGLPRRR